ncbi:ArgE/DapE family deacylase [Miniphocaeibacter massiliensis]|uniref:ArgE/DapE family deacylase n=1 Tax=Miniphocaeibacter massiliensis TaxID=2041841 RepID=UPI000C1C397A|nr:ArgE/DapE family deacylase [Miniphocaeibacter massiliensis]
MNRAKVDDWIDENKEELIGFLGDIIKIPSVTGSEFEIQKYLAEYSKQLGLDVEVLEPNWDELKKHPGYVEVSSGYENRPNVITRLKGAGEGKSLLLNGHTDVIPEGDKEKWKFDPWSATIEKNRMYGRGTSDMKSGVAAIAMSLKALIECEIKLKGDVITEYVIDEELSGNGTLDCVIRGIKADAGICCETSSMCIQPSSIGRVWFEIHINGKSAGIQKRFEGINAIDLGYIVHKIINEFENKRVKTVKHFLYPDILSSIPCMIGIFESGTYASAFPDTCILKGSFATVPNEDTEKVKEEFVDFLISETAKNDWLKDNPPKIEFVGYFAEPSEISIDSSIVRTLSSNYQKVIGEEATISGRQGAADIRFLNKYGNTPTVIFGPGKTEQMHSNNEWVDLDDYINSIKILTQTIMEWCEAMN